MLARSEVNTGLNRICDDNIVQSSHEGQIFLVDDEQTD